MADGDPETNDREVDVLTFVAMPHGLDRMGTFDTGRLERTREVDHTVGLDAQDFAVPFVDTNAEDARSTTFETDPFDQSVELTGTGKATVQLGGDGSPPVCVRLVDVAPDGRARPITQGTTRVDAPEHRGGPTGSDNPAENAAPVSVVLDPVSHVVEAGHRLRVAISAADFPSQVPAGTAESFVVTSSPDAPTTVRFPGRDGPPEPDASLESTREREGPSATLRRQTTTEFSFPNVEKTYELDAAATVATDDPDSLSASATVESTLDFDDGPATVTATVRNDPENVAVEATVLLDDEVAFEHEWTI